MFHDRIRATYEHLSPSYRKIAEFLLKSYDEAAFMGASDLADRLSLDPATVVRFSQRLGYSGYPELLRSIQSQVKLELHSAYATDTTDTSSAGRFQNYIRQDSANLEQALAHNPPSILEQAVSAMQNAKKTYVLAEGYAIALGQAFAHQLRQNGLQAEYISEDLNQQAIALSDIGADSTLFGISSTEYAIDVASAARFAKSEGATTVGCVGSLASPLARSVDVLLFAPAQTEGVFPTLTAIASVLNALAHITNLADEGAIAANSTRRQRAYVRLNEEREQQVAILKK